MSGKIIEKGDGQILQNNEWIWPGQLKSAYEAALFITNQVGDGVISSEVGAEMIAEINAQGILTLRKK